MDRRRAAPAAQAVHRRAKRRAAAAGARPGTDGADSAARTRDGRRDALLEAALQSISDGVLVVDGDGRFVLLNPAARAILDTDAEPTGPEQWQESFGIFLADGVTPCPMEDMPLVRALAGDSPEQVEFVFRNARQPAGTRITASARRLDPAAGVEGGGAVAVIRDITADRLLEDELRAERNRPLELLKALSDLGEGICIAREDKFIFVNDAYATLTGYRAVDLVESSADRVGADIDAVDEFRQWRRDLAAHPGTPVVMTTRIRQPNGRVLPVETSGIQVGEGPDSYRVSVNRDLTGRYRDRDELAERAADLQEANRALATARDAANSASRAKSAFLATMSHEIRTPLNAVIGLTEILLETGMRAEQGDLLDKVRLSGETLLSLINDLLDWSKIESGSLELEQRPFVLRDCVETAVTLLAPQTGKRDLDLMVEIGTACPAIVIGDVTRLQQILVNLVGNAVKFTEAGHVVVSVEVLDPNADADAGPSADPGAVGPTEVGLRFTVADTGVGMAADKMDRLFQDFSQLDTSTTRTHGGTGLGLAISQRLAQAMGGRIVATSTIGTGSTFSADLRFRRPATADDLADSLPVSVARPALIGRRALVVDDDPVSRRIITDHLAGWGMRSEQAASGAEALKVLRDDVDFDAAIVDFRMPGMTGSALLEAIAEIPTAATLPVVVLTSLTARDPVPSTDGHLARHLTRPVRAAELGNALVDALAGTPPDAGSTGGATVDARLVAGGRAVAGGGAAPAAAPPPAATPPPAGSDLPAAADLRVLLVEDSPVNRTVAQLMLARLGYTVDVATNGRDAVAAARRTPYDVVLMDVQMPVMDGFEATRQLRRDPPPGPRPWVVALTASALVEDREECAASGMDDYLSKPVRRTDLAAVLARVPRHSRSPAA